MLESYPIPIRPHRVGAASLFFLLALVGHASSQDNWPSHRGPNQNYQLTSEANYPTSWSVASGENIRWVKPLPETGQSGIAAWGDKLYLTCFRKLSDADNGPQGTWVSETRGHCLAADTGEILWSCDLPGRRPNQVNGTFTDSTTPTPVTDGKHVWFVSAGGFMACYTVAGEKVWEHEFEVRTKHSAKQFQPFLEDGKLHYVMMRDADDPLRRQQTAKDWDKNSKSGWPWMFVRTFDALTGKPEHVLPAGISVHSKGAIGKLDGGSVLLHATGGSHFPPEQPFGIRLSRLDASHDLIWERSELSLEGTHFVDQRYAYCFDKNDLVLLNLANGKTVKRIPIRGQGRVITFDDASGRYQPPVDASTIQSRRLVTHRSNLGFGKFHFFMADKPGFLGRIDIETGAVEYLQVPLQVAIQDGVRTYRWQDFEAGDKTGSGFEVQGDRRRLSHGFGHISAATPIAINGRIYFSTVLGTTYVIDATVDHFDENALIAVNDLGLPGETWSLSPLTAAGGNLYQRTSKAIICIGANR